MDNKNLGIILIIASLLIGGVVYTFHGALSQNAEASCTCGHSEGETCPMDDENYIQTYAGIFLIGVILSLGLYLLFFEKSQKEIMRTLKKQRINQNKDDKFNVLLMALDEDEKKIIKAVREQDGITQQTLRLRTSLHKSKLSILLDSLAKKNLISKEPFKKTNKIHLKISL